MFFVVNSNKTSHTANPKIIIHFRSFFPTIFEVQNLVDKLIFDEFLNRRLGFRGLKYNFEYSKVDIGIKTINLCICNSSLSAQTTQIVVYLKTIKAYIFIQQNILYIFLYVLNQKMITNLSFRICCVVMILRQKFRYFI